jgi:hypothetical protein
MRRNQGDRETPFPFGEHNAVGAPDRRQHRRNVRTERQSACLFRLFAAFGHQKLLRTAKHSAFQPAYIKFVRVKNIQNQHKHIIG